MSRIGRSPVVMGSPSRGTVPLTRKRNSSLGATVEQNNIPARRSRSAPLGDGLRTRGYIVCRGRDARTSIVAREGRLQPGGAAGIEVGQGGIQETARSAEAQVPALGVLGQQEINQEQAVCLHAHFVSRQEVPPQVVDAPRSFLSGGSPLHPWSVVVQSQRRVQRQDDGGGKLQRLRLDRPGIGDVNEHGVSNVAARRGGVGGPLHR